MAEAIPEFNKEKYERMVVAVGKGISAFGGVEAGLTEILYLMLEPGHRWQSATILAAARHIETKCRIINAVGNKFLWPKGDYKTRFRNIMNRVKKRADLRHKIAHWTVVYYGEGAIHLGIKKPLQLLPSSYRDEPIDQEGGLTVEEIEGFISDCKKLTQDIYVFINDCANAKARS